MSNELPTPEGQTCDVCGQAGAVEIGESKLCAECYSEAGSSCAGGGHDKSTQTP